MQRVGAGLVKISMRPSELGEFGRRKGFLIDADLRE